MLPKKVIVGCKEYKVSGMCQTEYSSFVEFRFSPTRVDFVHKVFDHKDFSHLEFYHKEVDHKEVGDHIGHMEFVKQIDHTDLPSGVVILL